MIGTTPMSRIDDQFLDELAGNLQPVKPLSDRRVHFGLLGLGIIGIIMVSLTLGPRADLLAGQPHPMFLFRAGTLLMLGGICAAAAAAMARPGVGRSGKAWLAALAMAAIVPITALGFAISDPAGAFRAVWHSSALWCIGISLSAAAGFATIMVVHLRRGAPVSPERAATVTGLASGSLGVLVYAIHCPANHIAYIGLWYSLAIALATLGCRIIIPRLIRW